MFFWRRVAPQIPEEGVQQTATPGYMRNFRDLNDQVARGKSFSGYERNALFLNRKGDGFADVGAILGVDYDDDARAVATVDWDRDGNLDMWVANRTAPQLRLLRNGHDEGNRAITILLIGNGKTTNRDAIGARLKLVGSSDQRSRQIRTVHAGDGFLAQSSQWIHFGIGEREDDTYDLEVDWPGGGKVVYPSLESGERYIVTQDRGIVPSPRVAIRDLPELVRQDDQKMLAPKRSGFWVANQVPFPELTFTAPDGSEQTTTQFLGKPILINLWATWCAPCLAELKELAGHAEDLEALGATVLALNVNGLSVSDGLESKTPPKRVLDRAGYELPYGIARQENLAKIEILIEYLSSRRSSLSIPTSILVDAEGNVAAVYLQSVGWEELGADLRALSGTPDETMERASGRKGRWFANPLQVDRSSYLADYATLYGTNGFPEESQRLYQLVRPDSEGITAQGYYNRAKSAAQQGETVEAIKLYQESIRLNPQYGRALTGLGAIYLAQKRIDDAQSLFDRAIEIDPNHATALINLAMIDQMRGNLEAAVRRLRKVVSRNSEYHEAQLSLGAALASMKQHEEAIQHLVKAVELNPKSVVGHLNLAKVFAADGKLQQSERVYRTVVDLDPRMAYPHFWIGNLQVARGEYQAAVASFQKAISLGANNAATFTRLAESLIAEGEELAGRKAFQRALELNPDYPRALAGLEALKDTTK